MIENGRETDQLNENEDDQVADNKVINDDMSESDYKMHIMNIIKTTMDDIMHNMNKRFKEREELMNKGFDELNTILDERKELIGKGFNKIKDVLNKQDEKWKGDRCQLKENTEVESKQVSGSNGGRKW